jgi:hypothetical protein
MFKTLLVRAASTVLQLAFTTSFLAALASVSFAKETRRDTCGHNTPPCEVHDPGLQCADLMCISASSDCFCVRDCNTKCKCVVFM